MQLLAVRMTGFVEPFVFRIPVEIQRIHDQCVPFPSASRVPFSGPIRLLGMLPSIHKNFAPLPIILEMHEHSVEGLEEFEGPAAQQNPWKTVRSTSRDRGVLALEIGISSRLAR